MGWWLTGVIWVACLAAGAGGRLLAGRSDRFALWWWGGLAVLEAGLSAAAFATGNWLTGVPLAILAAVCGWTWRGHWRRSRLRTWWAPVGRSRSRVRVQMQRARERFRLN